MVVSVADSLFTSPARAAVDTSSSTTSCNQNLESSDIIVVVGQQQRARDANVEQKREFVHAHTQQTDVMDCNDDTHIPYSGNGTAHSPTLDECQFAMFGNDTIPKHIDDIDSTIITMGPITNHGFVCSLIDTTIKYSSPTSTSHSEPPNIIVSDEHYANANKFEEEHYQSKEEDDNDEHQVENYSVGNIKVVLSSLTAPNSELGHAFPPSNSISPSNCTAADYQQTTIEDKESDQEYQVEDDAGCQAIVVNDVCQMVESGAILVRETCTDLACDEAVDGSQSTTDHDSNDINISTVMHKENFEDEEIDCVDISTHEFITGMVDSIICCLGTISDGNYNNFGNTEDVTRNHGTRDKSYRKECGISDYNLKREEVIQIYGNEDDTNNNIDVGNDTVDGGEMYNESDSNITTLTLELMHRSNEVTREEMASCEENRETKSKQSVRFGTVIHHVLEERQQPDDAIPFLSQAVMLVVKMICMEDSLKQGYVQHVMNTVSEYQAEVSERAEKNIDNCDDDEYEKENREEYHKIQMAMASILTPTLIQVIHAIDQESGLYNNDDNEQPRSGEVVQTSCNCLFESGHRDVPVTAVYYGKENFVECAAASVNAQPVPVLASYDPVSMMEPMGQENNETDHRNDYDRNRESDTWFLFDQRFLDIIRTQ